jgi:transcriptional regulator with XRE-family HTH domain
VPQFRKRTRAKPLPPVVRVTFAKRLKQQREKGGYARARAFAEAIGVEENRYTRYERAETEPDLTLIQKICETLRITPNELFGVTKRSRQGADDILLELLTDAHERLLRCLDIVSRTNE